MVVAWQPRRPLRAFTHLTFTGEERFSSPVCCDLSRVARIAPAWPLPRHVLKNARRETPDSDFRSNLEALPNNFKEGQAMIAWLNKSGCVKDSSVCGHEAAATDRGKAEDDNAQLRKRPRIEKFLTETPSGKRFKTES
ncbi:hypothetical protein FHG87_010115 [Trinorchestia longiramus]|nr:hypothetical protein FHG87_010115 [Trinorchestia longiramus]